MSDEDVIKLRPWMIGIIMTTLISVGGTYMALQLQVSRVQSFVDNDEAWRSELKASVDDLRVNVTNALDVAAQHGEEFNQVRTALVSANDRITFLDKKIETKAGDRFTYSHWSNEKSTIMQLLEAERDARKHLEERVKKLEK